MTKAASASSRAPATLLAAAVVVLLEGLLTAALGVLVGVEAFRGDGSAVAGGFMAVFGVFVGAALVLVARGISRCRRWSRAPALVVQVLCVPVAITLAQGGRYAVGIPLLLVAVLCVLALLSSPATKAFEDAA